MESKHPMYAKLVFPSLKRCGEATLASNLSDLLEKLVMHLFIQMYKKVPILVENNAMRCAQDAKISGSPTKDNCSAWT